MFTSVFSQTNEQGQELAISNRSSILKLNLMQTLIGEFLVGWEQQYFPRFSLEAELGICISEMDLLFGHYNHYSGLQYYHPEDAGLYTSTLKTETTSAIGPAIGIGARFYANTRKGTLSGWYIAPKINYKRVNFSMSAHNNDGVHLLDKEKGNDNVFALSIEAGYQLKLKRLYIDPFFGLKTYYRNYNALAPIVSWKNSAWEYKWYHVNSKDYYALPTLGLKIGFLVRK